MCLDTYIHSMEWLRWCRQKQCSVCWAPGRVVAPRARVLWSSAWKCTVVGSVVGAVGEEGCVARAPPLYYS